jgi:hypothetical protein
MIEMENDINAPLETIMGGISCPKGYKCHKSGFQNLCGARDIGIESFLECLERNPSACPFSFAFGLIHLCQCPLRIYIAKHLNK